MNKHLFRAATCAAFLGASAISSAQVTVIASESFEYPAADELHLKNGGAGWLNEWFVVQGTSDILLFDATATPPFALDDGVGAYAGQAVAFGEGYRKPDPTPHPDVAAGGLFGFDGATMWVSFSAALYTGSTTHFGGISLNEQGVGEQLFLGSPWNSNGWGFDDEGPNGAPEIVIPGTDNTQAARIVTRIDFAAGGERLRMWIDPPVPYPTTPADLDEMVHDFVFDEIRISSGGDNGEGFYFDAIEIAKGDPVGTIGMNYCGPAVPNSAGLSGEMRAIGSTSVGINAVSIEASNLPTTSFGFFIASMTQGLVVGAGGSQGDLCLGGAIGRYVGPGQIMNSGNMGTFTLPIDLGMMPQPAGFVAVLPGQTWNFQCWHRDVVGGTTTSNFTDATSVTFVM